MNKTIIVVKDRPPFGILMSLLTTEDVNVLVAGVARPKAIGKPAMPHDPLGLPINSYQCCHVERHTEELSEGVNVTYNRCTNSVKDGWLCGYHTRLLLNKRLSPFELGKIAQRLSDQLYDEVPEGIIKTDLKAIAAYPIKRLNGLRVQAAPQVPQLKPYAVQPEWEKVELNG